jgi:hypothetical protein
MRLSAPVARADSRKGLFKSGKSNFYGRLSMASPVLAAVEATPNTQRASEKGRSGVEFSVLLSTPGRHWRVVYVPRFPSPEPQPIRV